MKLIDAIRNVIIPEDNTYFHAPTEAICDCLAIPNASWDMPEEADARLKSYPIFNWICTDTHVGLSAIYLDDEPMGCSMQTARKNSIDIEWLSKEHAEKVRAFILQSVTPTFAVIDPEAEISEFQHVEFAGQSLTDKGFFEGRPVTAKVWYDSFGRTTPEQYRTEDRAYFEARPFRHPEANHVLVQDGDETRVIPVSQFAIPLNVREVGA